MKQDKKIAVALYIACIINFFISCYSEASHYNIAGAFFAFMGGFCFMEGVWYWMGVKK